LNNQQEYTSILQKVLATTIQVANLKLFPGSNEMRPGQRFNEDKYELHDERNVGLNEVVFDLDWPSYVKNHAKAQSIIDVLNQRGIPFLICPTGGKGIHIHIFFNKLNILNPKHKEILKKGFSLGLTWKHIRKFIWNAVLDDAGIENKLRGHGKYVDSAPISFNHFAGTSHLIRDIGGRKITRDKADSGFVTAYKTYVPYSEFTDKKLKIKTIADVTFPGQIGTFEVDENELIDYVGKYIKYCKQHNIEESRNEQLTIDYLNMDGVLRLKEGADTGQRSLGAMTLCVAAKIDRKTKEEATKILQEYVKNCSQTGHEFRLEEAKHWLDWIYSQQNVYWNCSQLENLGFHTKETCEFCQSKNKKALDFLKSTTILKQIEEVLDIEIIGEKETKLLIFLLMLSKNFPSKSGTPNWNVIGDPISQNIILSSDSGSGKSYVIKRILEIIGEEEEDYFCISRMTKNSINYYTDINMDGKIIFIEEMAGLDEHTSQLRVWMSEGKLTLNTVEKVPDADGIEVNTLVKKSTQGQPVFVSGLIESNIEEQMLNRSWVVGLDTSEKQTEDILDFQDKMQKRLIKIDALKTRIIKDSIKQLKPYHFIIPFSNRRALNIPSKEVRARRDYEKLMTLIKCSAYLHQYQREIKEIDGKEYIICDIKDYDIARRYAQNILGATFSGLTNDQIDLVGFVRKSSWKEEFGIVDIQRNKGKSKNFWGGMLSQLENLGYFEADRAIGKSTIYALNEHKAFNIINLPSGVELLKKIEELGIKNGQNNENIQNNENTSQNRPNLAHDFTMYKKISELGQEKNLHGFLSSCEVCEVIPKTNSAKHLSQNFYRAQLHASPEIRSFVGAEDKKLCDVGHPTKSELSIYIKNSEKHYLSIEILIDKFGVDIEDMIKEMLKEGDLFEPKRGNVMVLD